MELGRSRYSDASSSLERSTPGRIRVRGTGESVLLRVLPMRIGVLIVITAPFVNWSRPSPQPGHSISPSETANQSSLCEHALGAAVKMGFIIIALILSLSHPATAQATGSICVAARIDDPFWKQPATLPNGQINSQGLRVKVDKRPSIAWPDRKSLKYQSHLVDGLFLATSRVRLPTSGQDLVRLMARS